MATFHITEEQETFIHGISCVTPSFLRINLTLYNHMETDLQRFTKAYEGRRDRVSKRSYRVLLWLSTPLYDHMETGLRRPTKIYEGLGRSWAVYSYGLTCGLYYCLQPYEMTDCGLSILNQNTCKILQPQPPFQSTMKFTSFANAFVCFVRNFFTQIHKFYPVVRKGRNHVKH